MQLFSDPLRGTPMAVKTTSVIVLFVLFSACAVSSVQINRAKRLYEKGQFYVNNGEIEKAVDAFEKSIRISRSADFKLGEANNLNELGLIYNDLGKSKRARELFNKALIIYKEEDMAAEISKTMNNIAGTYLKEQKFAEAFKQFEELVKWDTKTGNIKGAGIVLYNMAKIHETYLGMPDKAKAFYLRALESFRKTGDRQYIEKTLQMLQKY